MSDEPLLKFPDQLTGKTATCYLYSFAGFLLTEDQKPILPCHFIFEGQDFWICPPFRLGHQTWRPIPLLNDENVERVFGDIWKDSVLQIAVFPAKETSEGASLTFQQGRGSGFDDSLPEDSFVVVSQADEDFFDKLTNEFLPRFLSWLRVFTKQWWIGRSVGNQTGNLHFQFEISSNGTFDGNFGPRAQQTTAPSDCKFIDESIWIECIKQASNGNQPDWLETLRDQIFFLYHTNEEPSCILSICNYAEAHRDKLLNRKKIKIKNLKTSSTDLLKQVSIGFETVFQRNLENESDDLFEFLKACWITRGHLAHGKKIDWVYGDCQSLTALEGPKLSDLLNQLDSWFNSI